MSPEVFVEHLMHRAIQIYDHLPTMVMIKTMTMSGVRSVHSAKLVGRNIMQN